MSKHFFNIWRIWTVVSLLGTTVLVSPAFAATVTSANDFPTTLQTGQSANHQLIFTTPSGVLEGQTVTLTFSSSFETAAITEDDVDLADDGTDLTTATDCSGTERASVAMADDRLTLTICAGDGGAIAAASQVTVEIGTNASASGTGANRITNPSSVGTYFVTIGGTFGDFGSVALPIHSGDDTVAVSVTVPNISSGGSGGGGGGGGGGGIGGPGAGGDTTAPTISNLVVSGVTETAATITWATNEASDSAVDYGLTNAFELGAVTDNASVTNHSLSLTSLSGGRTYFFRVRSKDASGNEAASASQSFTTLDLTAPAISNIAAVDVTQQSARVTWTTDEASTSVVEYGTNVTYGSRVSDAALVTSHSVTLTGLTASTQYHFRVRSLDAAANSALSLDNTLRTTADNPPANVSNLTITKGDAQLVLSWRNPTDADLAGIRVLECTDANPSGPNDNTGCTHITDALATTRTRTGLINGRTYFYGVFAFDQAGQFASGAVGSGMPTASEEEVPTVAPVPKVPSEEPTEEPSDEPASDDEGASEQPGVKPESGLVSEGQPNGQPGPSESGTPSLSGAGDVRLERNDLELSVAGGTIILSLGEKGTIDILPKTLMRLMVSQDELLDLRTLTVTVDEQTYLLRLENQPGGNALYFADITAPEAPQLYTMGVTAQYTDGGTQAVSSLLNVVPWGAAVQVIDGEEAFVSGVKATLSEMVGGKSVVWDGSPYNQFNPATTGVDGTFGWYVPNGTYRLSAQADTFLSYAGDSFTVRNFIANPRIVLVAVPKPTEEESANIVETAKKAAVVVASKLENVLNTPLTQTVQETLEIVRESETVQKTVDIATPTIAVTAGASVLVMTVAFDLLPFLHYVFTAPILLLWRRKRKGYGVVYHAVSRLPVDLAVVRLFLVEDETKPGPGRLIQSRVTDKQGRFFFLIQPGSYRLTATKAGLRFPTDYLKEVRDDGTYLDVYHGELIRVTEQDAVITPNIPLDPVEAGQTQSSTRAVWQARLRWLQRLVAVSGVLISFAVLLIRPSVLAGAMMIVQVLVYLLARRLARPRKPKNWGIVYDRETKRPLANVVARVFEPKYNKLLHTVVTDTRGRYAFLLGPSEYYAVFEKQGYRPTQVRPIDLRGKAGALDFAVDVEMHVAQAPSVPVGPTQPGEAIGPEDSS